MPNREAEALRRKIKVYREYIEEGTSVEMLGFYLREIAEAEAALNKINPVDDRVDPDEGGGQG